MNRNKHGKRCPLKPSLFYDCKKMGAVHIYLFMPKFWETHSIADYWDELEEGKDVFKRPKLTPVTLKFDPLVLKKIQMLARKRGISYNAYIRYLIAKSVEKEMLPASR